MNYQRQTKARCTLLNLPSLWRSLVALNVTAHGVDLYHEESVNEYNNRPPIPPVRSVEVKQLDLVGFQSYQRLFEALAYSLIRNTQVWAPYTK